MSLEETSPDQSVLWWDDAPSVESAHPSLPARADVVVVGAGITGMTTALLLAEQGTDVVLVEAGVVGRGTTGTSTGKVTAQHGLIYADMLSRNGADRTAAYAEAQQHGMRRIADIVARENIECGLTVAPAYVFDEGGDARADLEREWEVAATLGFAGGLDEGDIGLPWPVASALRFDEQMMLNPYRYCTGLARAFTARGGVIVEGVLARDVHEEDRTCRVETEAGTIEAGAVVMATLTPFVERGLFFARTRPVRSYVLAAEHPAPPDGMYISATDPVRSIRPHHAGGKSFLIAGGGGHPTGRDGEASDHQAELVRWASDRLDMSPRWHWSAQDFVAADGVPFIGAVTGGSRRIFVATGYAKWGLTNGTAAAIMISDAILGRENPWHEAFDATRIDAAHSAGLVASQGAVTAGAFVKDRIASLTSRDVDAIAPGSGEIIRDGGTIVAAYRDDAGRIHAVDARCTHLGCIVRFNDAERSWDCPCHGSRFDTDGCVLNGPATRNLEPVPIKDQAQESV